MANERNGTTYVGVTSDLVRRAGQHRAGTSEGFAGAQGCTRLVFPELYEDMPTAVAREKQLKGGSRAKKVALIEARNPLWRDLYDEIT